ncbi:MAG TPA: hypothetical protein VFB89_00495, partial [Gemmatimonadales bacterium]|nr:hypothetical protein [Gemmatimonadales bacterium]
LGVGFVAGFVTFRRSLRWCVTCGAVLRCTECTQRRPRPEAAPVKPPQRPPLVPGDVLRVEEPDYLYGVGPAVLRVTAVGVAERLPDGWWLNLRGIAVRPDGSPRCTGSTYQRMIVTAERNEASAERQQPDGEPGRNDLLRQARLRTCSPDDPTRAMSQRELAEAVTAYVQRTTGRDVALDRHDISRWERGGRRWPDAHYRDAFRAVLGVATDAELGFYIKSRPSVGARPARSVTPSSTAITANGGRAQPSGADVMAAQLVVNPGPAVILASATPELLNAVVPLLAALKRYHVGDEPSLTTVGTG